MPIHKLSRPGQAGVGALALLALLLTPAHAQQPGRPNPTNGTEVKPTSPARQNLPPPRTPDEQVRPTPAAREAQAELNTLRQLLPKAFYNSPQAPNFAERYRPVVVLRAQQEYEREQGYKFDKLIRGDPHKKQIALTFDDGPHPVFTLELLDILRRNHAPATFFVVGKQVEKYPTLVQLELLEGHIVGNHTYDHVNLTQIPPELIGYELDECDRVIKQAAGASVRFFRPPGGDYDADVVREAARRGYITTLWTDDPGDFANPGADVILRRALDNLEPGAILLLHDGIAETLSILPQFIAEVRRRGYEIVPLTQLALGRER